MFVLEAEDIPENAERIVVLENGGHEVTLNSDPEAIARNLNNAKSQKHEVIEQQYQASLKSGFQSGENFYSSNREDLQDLVNAVTTGINQEFKSMDGAMRAFTPPQIKQVLIDVTAAKLNLVKWRDEKRAAIEAAITIEELELI